MLLGITLFGCASVGLMIIGLALDMDGWMDE